jgi:hypothetical protein
MTVTGHSIKQENKQMIDNKLILKDAGAMTASGHCTVSGAAKTIDLGAGIIGGKLIVHVLSAKHSVGDEAYTLVLEVCENADFTGNKVIIGGLSFPPISEDALSRINKAPLKGEDPFINVPYAIDAAGSPLRYCRLYATIAGTAPSIDFIAYLVK